MEDIMSKINCDVCGTAYPETAAQCPICGCVRPAAGTAVPDSEDAPARNSNYTYVKGGRFSKANVRKRNQGMPAPAPDQLQEGEPDELLKEETKTDKGLILAVCFLLIAVVAVVIYIVSRFFGTGASGEEVGNITLLPTESTSATVLVTEDEEATEMTTEETVAETVEETVEATVEATVEVTTPETQPNNNYYVEPYTLKKTDVTIYRKGSFRMEMRDATGEVMDLEWIVEDPEICSVEGDMVTGLKVGRTTVYTVVNGTTYACIVRVKG